MHQGPVPTQLCCGTIKLGGTRPTRMKESHEVHEIRQGSSDERPLCGRHPRRFVLRSSYTVGYIYVTGTVTAQSTGNGIISGYKIDHNTGYPDSDQYVSRILRRRQSGPRRAGQWKPLPLCPEPGYERSGRRHLHHDDPCQNSNITQFAVGGNGTLTYQQTFYTQGINPFRIMVDGNGSYLLALDHDAPSSAACQKALGSAVTSCGDITVFKIDSITGRLSVVTNAQVSSASGSPLTYFPVPANPIDFVMSSGNVLTLSGTPATGDAVFPYTYDPTGGQLKLNQNTAQPLGINEATAILQAGSTLYVLDNEPITIASGSTFNAGTYPSQILPYTVGPGGALQAQTSGAVPDASTQSNPVWAMQELGSSGKFLYVANQGNNVQGNNTASGIAGYFMTNSPSFQLSFIAGQPWSTGSGPQCLVEDPSNQFVYTANYNDSTVTGRIIDPNSGVLTTMRKLSKFTLPGPPTWCLVDGRTN